MNISKKEKLFAALCFIIFMTALVYVIICTRMDTPRVAHKSFDILITYEKNGETITAYPTYICDYLGDGEWIGYYEESGMSTCLYNDEANYDSWLVDLDIHPGYLMGDPDYADYYAAGLPSPTFIFNEYETGAEYTGLDRIEAHDINLVRWEIPAPIDNEFTDSGAFITPTACVILTALALLLFLFSLFLIEKKPEATQHPDYNMCRIYNLLIALIVIPFLTLVCMDWDLVDGIFIAFLRLIPVVGALCVCASVILRKKGKLSFAMGIQFVGPVLLLLVIFFLFTVYLSLYTALLIIGVLAGIFLAVFSKRQDGVIATTLDRISLLLNIMLVPVYFFASILFVVMGDITDPTLHATTLQVILTLILSVLIALVPIYCGVSLGLSVAWRKKGKSSPAFMIQFVGFLGIAVSFIILLLSDLLPWVSITFN